MQPLLHNTVVVHEARMQTHTVFVLATEKIPKLFGNPKIFNFANFLF